MAEQERGKRGKSARREKSGKRMAREDRAKRDRRGTRKRKRTGKTAKKKSGILSYIFLGIVFIAGVGLLSYPTVSDWWNSFHQSRAIMSYAESISNLNDEEYERLLTDAREYNARILERSNVFLPSEEEHEYYENLLNFAGNGVIGYIEIPVIGVQLPIYHDTTESVLQVAVGHLNWTSLPTGGTGTHCVLSGHRGLPSARLFTDLDKLVVGDTFLIDVLDETLTYEVDQILIVLPQEVGPLQIVDGEDYCTLVTCTPYGINTHRMLVRGHRIANAAEARVVRVTADATMVDSIIVAPFVGAPLAVALFIWMFWDDKSRTILAAEEEVRQSM